MLPELMNEEAQSAAFGALRGITKFWKILRLLCTLEQSVDWEGS